MKWLSHLICFAVFGISSHALGQVFHASPGTDTLFAARDAARAWHVQGHSNATATIHLSRGVYSLTKTLTLDAQDANTAWIADEPEKTVISGGRMITNFVVDAASIWQAQTALPFEQLFLNGCRISSRTPGDDFFTITKVTQIEQPNGRAQLTIQVPDAAIAALPTNDSALHAVQLFVFHKWDTSRYAISGVDVAEKTITVDALKMQSANPWNLQSRFVLENCPLDFNQPGQWHWTTKGKISYYPLAGETLARTECIVPAIDKFLVIQGVTNLQFHGLRFRYTGYHLPPEGCPPLQAAARQEASIQIDDTAKITFADCEISHTGNYGIWFRHACRDCRVEHCLLTDLGAGGIRIGEMDLREHEAEQTFGLTVDDNIIRGWGRLHPSAVGIWIGQSANDRVTHNDVSDSFYTGISIGWSWGYGRSLTTNNLIAFNRIHKIGQGVLSDMGGIYMLGVSPGSICANNVVYDVRAHDYGGWGIYPDEGSTGWSIASNLVWNCTCVTPATGGAFHQHYGATNAIVNNIFALSSGAPLQATRAETHLSFVLEHNLIVSSNAPFLLGPWAKLQFESRSNCFANSGTVKKPFPTGNLASWQQAGHETGSIMTNLVFFGKWPDITLPADSPAFTTGFTMFDSTQAGVYGLRDWKRQALAPD